MNRHELGEAIAKEVTDRPIGAAGFVETLLQKCPYTAVRIVYMRHGQEYVGIGFAKVKWPDAWDEQYGIEMAVKKAAHDIARQICAEGVTEPVHA